jgi:hypothetical protein
LARVVQNCLLFGLKTAYLNSYSIRFLVRLRQIFIFHNRLIISAMYLYFG